ncbi:MAG: SOS response-associated peptidase [Barnesiella sp.]
MCFHNSMNKKARELAERYKRSFAMPDSDEEQITENYHITAFTNPDYPVVTGDKNIQVFKWGLIPFWIKTRNDAEEIRKMTYNAKAETLYEKPSFREPVKCHRCLIPSTGYFEWRHEGNSKIPYYIFLKDEEIFSMAGIYDIWEDPETGDLLHTFSIITTTANSLTSYIHNTQERMPVIIPVGEEERWLSDSLSKDEINAFLKPYDAGKMDAYVIVRNFLKWTLMTSIS